MVVLCVIVWLAVGYLLIVFVMYLAQTRLIFPTYLASFEEITVPASGRRIRIYATDGVQLAGVMFSPVRAQRTDEALLLGFGGNIWNVDSMALSLHQQFPSMHVAGFHYRGYGPSPGKPSAT